MYCWGLTEVDGMIVTEDFRIPFCVFTCCNIRMVLPTLQLLSCLKPTLVLITAVDTSERPPPQFNRLSCIDI